MKCKGETFFNNKPMFAIQEKDIIKKSKFNRSHLRLGTIPVGKKKMYAVEDGYSTTRYKSKKCALEHYNYNLKINKEMAKLQKDRK